MPRTLWILTLLTPTLLCLIGGAPPLLQIPKTPLFVSQSFSVWCALLESSYSSADIVINMIKVLFLQKVLTCSLLLFIYSLFISIRVYKSYMFKGRN